jgi:Fe-only nitrogenase delta subunit
MEELKRARIEQLLDYIMKNCLWQFHSRVWDRKRQNEGVLSKTTQLLCGDAVSLGTPEDRCYWVDAVCLADAYKSLHPWIAGLGSAEIRDLMQGLHERLDFLTITGSLNLELTDEHY